MPAQLVFGQFRPVLPMLDSNYGGQELLLGTPAAAVEEHHLEKLGHMLRLSCLYQPVRCSVFVLVVHVIAMRVEIAKRHAAAVLA